MPKRVLDVGQCSPDHAAIRALVQDHFGAEVVQAHDADEALAALRAGRFDLVLVNRKLDRDHGDGLEIIRRIKGDAELAHAPAMLITNFEEHQQAAVAVGAAPGFGKAALDDPQTHQRLSEFLS